MFSMHRQLTLSSFRATHLPWFLVIYSSRSFPEAWSSNSPELTQILHKFLEEENPTREGANCLHSRLITPHFPPPLWWLIATGKKKKQTTNSCRSSFNSVFRDDGETALNFFPGGGFLQLEFATLPLENAKAWDDGPWRGRENSPRENSVSAPSSAVSLLPRWVWALVGLITD